jgi:hypothetical protein
MITPLQIDSYTRDLWSEFDALMIAQLAPLAYDPCYRPRVYVGLDIDAQFIPASDPYREYGLRIPAGSLIYGFYNGLPVTPSPWNIQITDLSMDDENGRPSTFWSMPVSQNFVANSKGPAYPNFLPAPRPVTGRGQFLVQVWSQLATDQFVVPLIGVLEKR